MANVIDVAFYIKENLGNITPMKLQRLVYYSQAWHLVWSRDSLFNEKVEAWSNGPVVRILYEVYNTEDNYFENNNTLTSNEKKSIDSVLKFYGNKTSQELSNLTRREDPWLEARKGLSPKERGEKEITKESMIKYYSSL